MSLLEESNKKDREAHQVACTNSAMEFLAELEAKRIENERYKSPESAKFWARRKEQAINVRSSRL